MVKVNLAGIDFRLDLLHEKNKKRFGRFMEDQTKESGGYNCSDQRAAACPGLGYDSLKADFPDPAEKKEEGYVSWRDISFKDINGDLLKENPEWEYQYILLPISDTLLKYGKCVIHGTAFLWHGSGFIFMAPSGTGKSTQFQNWKRTYGKEVEILNGDKPILERGDGDGYYIHPSPWKGKEGWASMAGARLGGIICLEQASYNEIQLLDPSEAAIPVFSQLLYSAGSPDLIEQAVSFTRGILEQVPVWRLKNTGDVDSVILTHDTLTDYLDEFQSESP